MYEKVKAITKKKKQSISSCIKDEDGKVLMEMDQIKKRWTEYIRSLYSDTERSEKQPIRKRMSGQAITKEEIRDAMKQMKKNKAVGSDSIAIELIQALGNFGIDKITEIANHVYGSDEIPQEMLESVFIALPKKPGTIDCGSYRTISLMSHVTKIILRVMLNRNKKIMREKIADEQFGYKPGKGTRNAILCLKTLIEKSIGKQRDLFICYIDYVKAFDCVKHDKLMELIGRLEIDGKDLRLIQNLYYNQKAAIRINGELSDWVDIQKGVRQGCVLSPDLFNLYSEEALSKIRMCDGVDLEGTNYNNLRYADDTALIADSNEKLQRMLDIVTQESEKIGLRINCEKTYVMVVSKKAQTPVCDVTVNNIQIRQVDRFKYLGSWISSDGRSDLDVKCRIGQAKQKFVDMKNVLCSRKLGLSIRKRMLKCYVWSVLLYGCESWTISKKSEKRLEAAEMWFWRRMMRISWTEKLSTDEVLSKVGMKRGLLNIARKKQWSFIGHELRRGGIEKNIIEAEMAGKRARGRQRLKMLDWMMRKLCVKEEKQLTKFARDRMNWRSAPP